MLAGLSEGSAEGELDAMTLGAALLEGETDGLPLAPAEGWTLVDGEVDGLPGMVGAKRLEGELDSMQCGTERLDWDS